MATILVVDDSTSVRNMVAFTLKEEGYDVIEAEDGKDALGKASTSGISLVLSDVNMPNMDGITLCGELRKLPAYKFTPILMLTTESSDAMKQKEMRGTTGFWQSYTQAGRGGVLLRGEDVEVLRWVLTAAPPVASMAAAFVTSRIR
jgi:two-component system chemotaxis response regulator CheY